MSAIRTILLDPPEPLSSCELTDGCTTDDCPRCYPSELRRALQCAVTNLRAASALTMLFWPTTLGRNLAVLGVSTCAYLDGVYEGYDLRRREERTKRNRESRSEEGK